jgi:hypothetical protein
MDGTPMNTLVHVCKLKKYQTPLRPQLAQTEKEDLDRYLMEEVTETKEGETIEEEQLDLVSNNKKKKKPETAEQKERREQAQQQRKEDPHTNTNPKSNQMNKKKKLKPLVAESKQTQKRKMLEEQSKDEEIESEDETEFEVEFILDMRKDSLGAIEYLVKWKGWEASEATWEKWENCTHAANKVRDYHIEKGLACEMCTYLGATHAAVVTHKRLKHKK